MNKGSPFYIIQDFVSPMMAEDIVDSINFSKPDYDPHGKMLKSLFFLSDIDDVIFERLKEFIPKLEELWPDQRKLKFVTTTQVCRMYLIRMPIN